ncbi:MAG TPA: BTAD domain-containing putative transcriptional regulator [Nocardioides sp.]|uniref:BTAD domain-containing putative transcriptional regulator n=1 Tax=Nocardioides sp. TaxID=35761 RepID=UPI002E36AA7C|nr:BTAD domain-containing putative transcriptional regulator [Nocardioides sp.]HEX5086401.1 BTAD domain-containing putative transcriptional regulator [Nocardioides sp.]
MFTIAVLGPLEVTRDGRRVEVPTGKTSELLVRLALEAGAPVRADQLLDELWTAEDGPARRNTLQSKVAMLRRALGDPDLVRSRDGGYALAVDRSTVDALVALDLTASAAALLDAGDVRAAADLCVSALARFRGEVLPAAGAGDWGDPHRTQLEETRTQLVEMLYAARLRLGDAPSDLIGPLETEVKTYPFQEGLWELLITALYRAGRQADALATYQTIRTTLAEELGIDPRPQLRQLEQLILTQDPSLEAAEGGLAPARVAAAAGNLPSMSVELVGRADDVAALSELLGSRRLVEVVGPGGIGKTAVAIEVGRGLGLSTAVGSSGVWLARLESAATPDEVVDVLVGAVKGPGGEDALFERLRRTSAVVILDNCEHVLDGAAALAVRLLDAAPALRVLCTSQVPLGVEGEVVFDLEPLQLSDAVELFTRRAAAQRLPRTSGDDDPVSELCRSLDGLPLAIELAAARTKTLSITEITRRLDDRFSVLSDPTSRRPERRRALRSTIGWSYDLLFPDDQRGLWALATFAGGAPLPAVEFVLEALDVPAAAAIDVVGRLVSRSLVIVDDDAGSVRYRLLDSIRAFALEAMDEAQMSERALEAHATWFAGAASSSTTGVRSANQAEHLAFARSERANIEAALSWSASHDPTAGLRIANGFGWAWVVQGDSRGAQRILTALAAVDDDPLAGDTANGLLLAAWIEASTGSLERARDHVAAAQELADQIQDVDLQARCAYYLAYVVSHDGDFRRAMELTDLSRALYEGLDRPWDRVASGLFAARAALSAGEHERSVEAAAEVERWLQAVDDPWLHVRGEAMLGELARLEHRFHDAVHHIGLAADRSRQLGFQQTEAYQVMSLGRAQCLAGDHDAASTTLRSAIDKAQATGDVRLAALARVHLGRVLRTLGKRSEARAQLTAATSWHRDAGGGEGAALGACLLAAMDAAEQRDEESVSRLEAILETARSEGDAPAEVFALDALARLSASRSDHALAKELCETADRRMAAADHLITEVDRVDADWVRHVA